MLRAQFIRYVIVGLALNAALYAAYLLLTWLVMGSEAAMTLTFGAGTLLSFLANRNITFRHRGDHFAALLRFVACYIILYIIDFTALWVFALRMGVPHQIVQGCVVLVLPPLGFIMQKYWVFPRAGENTAPIPTRIS